MSTIKVCLQSIMSFDLSTKPKSKIITKSLRIKHKIRSYKHTTNFRFAHGGAQPFLTPEFILSDEEAPRLKEVLTSDIVPIPIIDMDGGVNEEDLADMVARASEEFGVFIVINHRLPGELWLKTAEAVRDLLLLPPEVKLQFPGEAGRSGLRVLRYFRNDWEDQRRVSMWSEVIGHRWHPSDHFAGDLPDVLPAYREHIAAYAKEMGVLMSRLLSLMSKGLGLEDGYLKTRLGNNPLLQCHGNYFPPCPNPELTLGLPVHTDSLALGVVRAHDDVPGLHILKDDRWVAVDQPPNSLIVNIGDQLEVLSNGRYKSVVHRVVNDESRERVSLAFFWGPDTNEIVGPIEQLVDEQNPRKYRSYPYKEFLVEHYNQEGRKRTVKQNYQL